MSYRSRTARSCRLSVVVPVLNEQQVLPELHHRLRNALEHIGAEYEVIFVDDGSTDKTPDLLEQIHSQHPSFKYIRFSRNFGHQAAVTAGLEHSSGDATCVMDADLQDPPEVLASLLEKWEQGYDVIYAVRRRRKESWIKVALYHLFYLLLSRLSAVPMPMDAGDFCLISREALNQINALPEKERFVRGLRAWVGFEQVGVQYERDSRQAGRPKYTIIGLLRLALSGIVSFSHKPLVYVMIMGLLVSGVAFIYAFYLVLLKIFLGGQITGFASLMGGLLFLSGIQLISLGVIGIYVSKIFTEVKSRPTYVISMTRGLELKNQEIAAPTQPRAAD